MRGDGAWASMHPMSAPVAIASPCIQVCAIDGQSGLCLGCHRTLAEIAGWTKLTDAERAATMAALPCRRNQIAPEKLGLFLGSAR